MNVLGIDFSLNGTGLVVFNGEGIVSKKLFTTKEKIYKADTDTFIYIPNFDKQEEKLDFVVAKIVEQFTDVDCVCMENNIGKYYSWMDGYGILRHYLRLNKLPYVCVAPSQVKKYAGNGTADKTQMSYFLRHEYNFDFDYLGDLANNLVDATWLSIIGLNYFEKLENKRIALSDVRKEILAKLMGKKK